MATFIESCNCRGLRPTGIVGSRHNMRPEIVGSLIKDRHVARYVIAPKGYGRSSIAFEYAQLVFAFKNVFWVRCSSPCFLRDLDAKTIRKDIKSIDPSFKLVVFDDIPMMDQGRVELFDQLVNDLLVEGCEVIGISTPAADSFSSLQLDKILIQGHDLLLSAEEIKIERLRGNLSSFADGSVPLALRSPSQIWGQRDGRDIVKGMSVEELPIVIKMTMFSILVLGKGTFEDLTPLLEDREATEAFEFLSSRYPILGIDLAKNSFEAAMIPIDMLGASFDEVVKAVDGKGANSAATLIGFLATALIAQGSFKRAIELVPTFLSAAQTGNWMIEHGFELWSRGTIFDIWKCANTCRKALSTPHWQLFALETWARWAIEDRTGVLRTCRTWALKPQNAEDSIICLAILTLLVKMKDLSEMDDKTKRALADKLKGKGIRRSRYKPPINGGDAGTWPDWRKVASAVSIALDVDGELTDGERILADMAKDWLGSGNEVDDDHLDTSELAAKDESAVATDLMVILMLSIVMKSSAISLERKNALFQSLSKLLACIGSVPTAQSMPFLLGAAASHLLEASSASGSDSSIQDSKEIIEAAKSFDEVRNSERIRFTVFKEKAQRTRDQFRLTHTGSDSYMTHKQSSQEYVRATVPTLFIGLFGGFSAKTKDEDHALGRITRAKSKKALSLLAVSKGNEVSKERMGNLLWPDADQATANRNFYVVWGDLKKNLSINGSCPYLIKSHVGYKLDTRHVSIDLEGFDDLCRRLLFGKDDMSEWEILYEKATGIYSAEILPEFIDDDDFKDVRSRCSMQLVDGLVSASMRMLDAGENRGAVWFAREALRHDDLREDVYKILIQSYIATEQRAAALDAYFQCRNRLRDELGIDPSPSIVELYRSIIEVEEKM